VKLAQLDNMDRLLTMTLPVATIAAPASTTISQDNSIARSALSESPTQAPATPTAKGVLPEEFSATTKISTVKFVHPVTIKCQNWFVTT